jgi:hypothetical protein
MMSCLGECPQSDHKPQTGPIPQLTLMLAARTTLAHFSVS